VSLRTEVLMGTTVTIETTGIDTDAAIDRAFDWFRSVEQICTRFDPQSELCQLTAQHGIAVPVSRLLFETVRFALHVAEASGGAFDPTIGAVMQQRGFNREHRTGATLPPLVQPTDDVSFRDVDVDAEHQTVTLRRPLLLDLGAVAKGLAIDLAARELEASRDFAIDAGGDLYLGGMNSEGQPWSIGIRHPRAAGEFIAAVHVTNQAVCTSGDYERHARMADVGPHTSHGPPEGGHGVEHHIIDPRTGTSPGDVVSVTVIASSAMLADALATAAFVLGPRDGLSLLENMGVDGLIVTGGLERIQTNGWPGA
jgi:thiamine biosynthesis lipoprotein